MHVAIISDDTYSPHVEVLLQSLADHHRPGDVAVTWCHVGLATGTQNVVTQWSARVGIRITFLDCASVLANHGWSVHEGLLYLRLLLPDLLTQESRLIFLDGDTVVTDSLWPLWNTAIGSKACGGVRDHWVGCPRFFAKHPPAPETQRVYGASTYINAGVLLFDCDRWRARGLTAAALAALSTEWMFLDQDALNRACADDIHVLDPRWNSHPGITQRAFVDDDVPLGARRALRRACARPGIVHYAGPFKPWLSPESGGSARWYYHRSRQRTRWRIRETREDRWRLRGFTVARALRRIPWIYGVLYRVLGSVRVHLTRPHWRRGV
jgi:lipopolysaccharide biosynthesis glycosyltransferase